MTKYKVEGRFEYYDEFDTFSMIGPITIEIEADSSWQAISIAGRRIWEEVRADSFSYPLGIRILSITAKEGDKPESIFLSTEDIKNESTASTSGITDMDVLNFLRNDMSYWEILTKMFLKSNPSYREGWTWAHLRDNPDFYHKVVEDFLAKLPPNSELKIKIAREVIQEGGEPIGRDLVLEYLRKHRHFPAIAAYWERVGRGKDYSPELVTAAEYYEMSGQLHKALELYQEGIERCHPSRIGVYDERTGGYFSATDFPELNKKEIEEAERLVDLCERKVRELSKKVKQGGAR